MTEPLTVFHEKQKSLRDGESNPGLPRSAEQGWASSNMTGGDTYHYTITDKILTGI